MCSHATGFNVMQSNRLICFCNTQVPLQYSEEERRAFEESQREAAATQAAAQPPEDPKVMV